MMMRKGACEMEKKERTLFYSEIEIPENVQKKADLAFLQIKNSQNERAINMDNHEIRDIQSIEKERKSRKRRKSFAAAAACAALIAAAGVGARGWMRVYPDGQTEDSPAEDSQIENDQIEIASDEETADYGTTISRAFALALKEAESGETTELTKGTPVAISVEADSWAIDGDEDGNCAYCISLPLVCEGDNIDSITYSINKGAFQIVEPEGQSIVTGGVKFTGPINTGQIGGGTDEATGESIPVSVTYYTEYTLDYDCQESDTTWINMCRDGVILSNLDLIWGEDRTLEELKKGYQELIDGVVVTCTVNFSDGTSQTAELETGTILTTAREAGIANAVDPGAEDVFFTFERK